MGRPSVRSSAACGKYGTNCAEITMTMQSDTRSRRYSATVVQKTRPPCRNACAKLVTSVGTISAASA